MDVVSKDEVVADGDHIAGRTIMLRGNPVGAL